MASSWQLAASQIRKIAHIRAPIADFVVTHLTIQAADGRIIIDRSTLNVLERIQVARAHIDNRHNLAPRRPPEVLAQGYVGWRIEEDVDHLAGGVARRSGPQERQHD